MITEKEFLDAFEIIKKYKNQVDGIYFKSEALFKAKDVERFVEIKRNDWIEITEGNPESKYFIKGARFRALSSNLYLDWNTERKEFSDFFKNKYGTDYDYFESYKNTKNSFELFQNDLIESGLKFCQIVTLSLPNKSSYKIKSINYKYKVVENSVE